MGPGSEAGTTKCILATHCARGLQINSAQNKGRREDRVHAAPAVSCAKLHIENAHEHTGSAEAIRPSLRNGFTAYFVLSPVTGFLATVASQKNSARLDASIGASGPHDFAVRSHPSSPKGFAGLWRRSSARIKHATTLPRPPHPIPTFVTMANAPLPERDDWDKPLIWV